MSIVRRIAVWSSLALTLVCGLPASASAQWYVAGYLGGNHTTSADVSVTAPAENLSATFHDVHFDARPLESPQYYGVRIGRLFGARRRFGLEGEFIHLKIYSVTTDTYAVSGHLGDVDLGAVSPIVMDTIVQRYSMTHGLNFVLINFVVRHPIGDARGRLALVGRAGVGPTVPHAETEVLDVTRQRYEYAGVGVHGAAGVDVRVRGPLSAVVEYQITFARPEISIHDGTGRTSAFTQQVAVGLAFGLSR